MLSPPKKYVCGYCARAFSRSEHKQRHERSHTNEKPFHCSYCASAFVRRDLLQRHCRTVHNIRLVARTASRERKIVKGALVVSFEATLKSDACVTSPKLLQSIVPPDTVHAPSNSLPYVSSQIPDTSPPESHRASSGSLPSKSQPLLPSGKGLLLDPHGPIKAEPESLKPSLSLSGSDLVSGEATSLDARTSSSSSLDTEPNIVASAKALLQLAPKNTSVDGLQMGPDTGLGTPMCPSLATSLMDISQVLLLAKVFKQYYFPEDLKYPLKEFFFIGYCILVKEPYNTLPTSHNETQAYQSICSLGLPHSFKVGLAYSILAVGCLSLAAKSRHYEKLSAEFINKARESLVEKSAPSHNTPTNQLELLSSLYLLTNVCMSYFNNDSTLAVLEQTTLASLQNLPHNLIDTEMDLLWKIYILVSESKPFAKPPKFYTWFLGQRLNGTVLAEVMRGFLSPESPTVPITGQVALVVISTLLNEMNSFTAEDALWVFSSRLELRDALAGINKSVSKGPSLEIFEVFKRSLLVDAPAPCKDLLHTSLFEITSASHVNLLLANLMELDPIPEFPQFLQRNLNSLFQDFVEEARGFFHHHPSRPRLGTNFGLVSFPLMLNELLWGLQKAPSLVSQLSLNPFERANLDILVLQWYATLVKTLVHAVSPNHAALDYQTLSENVVFQSLLVIVNERRNCELETGIHRIMPILEEAVRVCESWVQNKSQLALFQQNLFRFGRELLMSSLNQVKCNATDVYASNDSLLARNHRPKSIGSIEMALRSNGPQGLHLYQGLPLSLPGSIPKNYVLKGNQVVSPSQKTGHHTQMAAFLPAQKVDLYAHLADPHGQKTGPFSSLQVRTAIIPEKSLVDNEIPTILPPIHASLRASGHVRYDNLKSSE